MLTSDIPDFKSGVDDEFRSVGRYRVSPFVIATRSIVHEREQVLLTSNTVAPFFDASTVSVYLRTMCLIFPSIAKGTPSRLQDWR